MYNLLYIFLPLNDLLEEVRCWERPLYQPCCLGGNMKKVRITEQELSSNVDLKYFLLNSGKLCLSDMRDGTFVRGCFPEAELFEKYGYLVNRYAMVFPIMPSEILMMLMEKEKGTFLFIENLLAKYGKRWEPKYDKDGLFSWVCGSLKLNYCHSTGTFVLCHAEKLHSQYICFGDNLLLLDEYLKAECESEELRSENSGLLNTIETLLKSTYQNLDFKVCVKGFQGEYVNMADNNLSVDDAHGFLFDGVDYDLTRQELGQLAVALFSYLKERDMDLANVA